MRARLSLALIASAVALTAFAVWMTWPPAPPPTLPDTPRLDPAAEHDLVQKMLRQVAERETPGGTRTEVAPPPPPDGPRVRVQVVEAGSGAAVAAAAALDVARGERLGVADERGELSVPALPAGRLAFAKGGYLTRLVVPSTDLAVAFTQAGVVRVELTRDTFTLPMRVRFVVDGATFQGPVRFAVRCLDALPPSGGSFPTGRLAPSEQVPASLVEAWRQHTLVSQLPGLEDPSLHLGLLGHLRTFDAGPGAMGEVRLIASGRYRIEATASERGLVGQAEVFVDVGRGGPFEVELGPGRMLQGVVVDGQRGTPIASAKVRLSGSEGGVVAEVETGADGTFSLGPVPGAEGHVDVQARCYVDLSTTVPAGAPVNLPLTRRPTRLVRGIVRARPTLAPCVGATVEISAVGEVDARTVTRADGTFELETCAEAAQLRIRAEGFLPWLEMLYEPVDSHVCDLVPASADARLAAGLVARVSGRVLRPDGTAAAGLPVQLFSAESHLPEGIAGRAILEGHLIPVMPVGIAGADGAFTLEWPHAGPVKLLPTDGKTTEADAVSLNLALGQHVQDVILHSR